MAFTDEEIKEELKSFTGWRHENNALLKSYRFSDFLGAVEFVNKVALVAEHIEHHPDLIIEQNQVTVRVHSHEDEGITEHDFALVKAVEPLALEFL